MKTPFLFGATLLVGIGIGFVLDRGGEGAGGKSAEAAKHEPGRQRPGRREDAASGAVLAALLEGRSVKDLSAEDARRLITPYLESDPRLDPVGSARGRYQYLLLLGKLPLPVLEELLEEAARQGTRQGAITDIFVTYAERNPDKAMAWADKQPEKEKLRAAAIDTLASLDPVRAAELQLQELREGRGKGAMYDPAATIGPELAKLGQATFFRFHDSLPSGSSSGLYGAAANVPEAELPAFLKEVEKRMAEGKLDEATLRTLMYQLAPTRPEVTRQWLETLEAGMPRSRGALGLAQSLMEKGRTADADQMIHTAMRDMAGKEKEFIRQNFPFFISKDPALTLSLLPDGEELTSADVRGWVGYFNGRPEGMMKIAAVIHSPEERAAYVADYLDSINQPGSSDPQKLKPADFEILSGRIASLGLTGDAEARARAALEEAKTRGEDE